MALFRASRKAAVPTQEIPVTLVLSITVLKPLNAFIVLSIASNERAPVCFSPSPRRVITAVSWISLTVFVISAIMRRIALVPMSMEA